MITVLAGIPESWDGVADDHGAPPAARIGAECLGQRFLLAARRYGNRPAFVTASRQFTYRAIAIAAEGVAEYLESLSSFVAGDRVALLMANCPEYLAGLYGTLLAGGVAVPLPTQIDAERLRLVRRQCEAGTLLTRDADLGRRSDLADERVDHLDLSSPRKKAERCRPTSCGTSKATLAMLLYTSGSTGQPKGVMLSHGNLICNAESIRRYLPIRSQDRTLGLLPFCHAFGNSVLQTHLLAGAAVVVDGSTVFPNTIVDAFQHHGVTSFSGVPELYHALLSCSDLGRRRLPLLRYMTVAGGALEHESAMRVAELIAPAQFYLMYGQTEATARLAFVPPQSLPQKQNSIGQAIPDVELQVQDDDGEQVAGGVTGELCCRGPNTMLGYWRDPSETRRVLRNGWLRTGDLATADEDGFFYLTGRRKEQVKIRGMKVEPQQVAKAIAAHFPGCRTVAVPYTANSTIRLALFVAPVSGPPPSTNEVRRVCRATLLRHEVPGHVEIIDRIPLTPSLKVDLQALSSQLEKQAGESDAASATTSFCESLASVEQA